MTNLEREMKLLQWLRALSAEASQEAFVIEQKYKNINNNAPMTELLNYWNLRGRIEAITTVIAHINGNQADPMSRPCKACGFDPCACDCEGGPR